ncbi:MAG: ArsR family transcriptional regulator [Acidobacteria bacterium]|nr:MAG: ArsR family transcriptional regulator [Acidobacteriota bacterium]REK09641.1 MAG: ArsR family transcriptional regulator [Acidobacteriota bacterium]
MQDPTLDAVFGNTSATRVLLFLENYGSGHAARIARTFGMSPSRAREQLEKFESASLLTSRPVGRSRVFEWNPRSPIVDGLRNFLATVLAGLPTEVTKKYFRQRQRPRRSGKPLEVQKVGR